jgi:hypothetical protein
MSFIDNNGDRQLNGDDVIVSQYYSKDEKFSLSWRPFGHKKSLNG